MSAELFNAYLVTVWANGMIVVCSIACLTTCYHNNAYGALAYGGLWDTHTHSLSIAYSRIMKSQEKNKSESYYQ